MIRYHQQLVLGRPFDYLINSDFSFYSQVWYIVSFMYHLKSHSKILGLKIARIGGAICGVMEPHIKVLLF
jgi:hypothetical protein